MTSFFHDLEAQLRTAAQQRTGTDPEPATQSPKRNWLGRGLRTVPVLAAVAVTLAVMIGALLVLVPGHSHTPPTSPAGGGLGAILGTQSTAQVERELHYISQATRSAQQSGECRRTLAARIHVRLIRGRPSQAVLSVLGVLRRPPTAADHLATNLLDSTGPIYAGSIRRAFHAGGASFYVYVEHDTGAEYPSDRCLTMQLHALERALPTIPLPLRDSTRTLETRLVAYERKLKASAHQDILCFVIQAQNGESSSCGIPVSQLAQAGITPEGIGDVVGAIVPDGVASVTLRYPVHGGEPARSFTATVHGNAYAVRVGSDISGRAAGAPTIIWRDAGGHVIKVIAPPKPGAARQACQAHPLACLTVEGGSSERSSGSESATAAAPPTPHPKSGG